MTVRQLIAELQRFPDYYAVAFADHEYGACSVDHVVLRGETVRLGDGRDPDAPQTTSGARDAD